MTPLGAVTRTDDAGGFAFPRAIHANTVISVESEGCAKAWAMGTIATDGSLSFDTITLYPARSALVVIESDTPLPLNTYYASMAGTDTEELHPFPPGGQVELNGLGGGYHEVHVFGVSNQSKTICIASGELDTQSSGWSVPQTLVPSVLIIGPP